MAKEHIYKDNIIVEFSDSSFLATAIDIEGDPIEKTCKSLAASKRWIDSVEQIHINALNNIIQER